jgi:exodeoxyribonuclease VII large subunit
MRNAQLRWPGVRFDVREVAVQGASAVRDVTAAMTNLDANPDVDVIVIARGGGAMEDLLPFSDESLVRAAAACTTPLVSAIGHEQDNPLLDYVADLRASTPTDAAKRIVPDVSEQHARVDDARRRLRASLTGLIDREARTIEALRDRPVLANPATMLDAHVIAVNAAITRARHLIDAALLRATGETGALAAQVRALSPATTLARGYAVVHNDEGQLVRGVNDIDPGDQVHVRLAAGSFYSTIDDIDA